MKKLLLTLFIAMPLMALAGSNNEHIYKLTFHDGKVLEGIYTRSYSDNWYYITCETCLKKNDDCARFFFNDNKYFDINMTAIKNAEMEDRIVEAEERYNFTADGYITLRGVEKVEKTK